MIESEFEQVKKLLGVLVQVDFERTERKDELVGRYRDY